MKLSLHRGNDGHKGEDGQHIHAVVGASYTAHEPGVPAALGSTTDDPASRNVGPAILSNVLLRSFEDLESGLDHGWDNSLQGIPSGKGPLETPGK